MTTAWNCVGRVGFSTPGGPLILPVNYVFTSSRVIFRTSRRSPMGALDEVRVVIHADRITGWQVRAAGCSENLHRPRPASLGAVSHGCPQADPRAVPIPGPAGDGHPRRSR
jgi:hypothetical protein